MAGIIQRSNRLERPLAALRPIRSRIHMSWRTALECERCPSGPPTPASAMETTTTNRFATAGIASSPMALASVRLVVTIGDALNGGTK
jgi:hypothetical protein